MQVPFSDISPELFDNQIKTLMYSFTEAERTAIQAGLDDELIQLCQSGAAIATAIKHIRDGNLEEAKSFIKAMTAQLSEIEASMR